MVAREVARSTAANGAQLMGAARQSIGGTPDQTTAAVGRLMAAGPPTWSATIPPCDPPTFLVHYLTNEPTGPGVIVLDEGAPLFVQIAEQIADDIVDGALAEGAKVPSTNELAAFHRINPATAGKGINMLVDSGIVEKKRGLGMFVAEGARDRLRAERRAHFAEQYIVPMLAEARRLGLNTSTLITLIREAGLRNGGMSA